MTISFAESESGTGLTILDHVDRRKCTLETREQATPTPTDTDDFVFPVDDAVDIPVDTVSLPNVVATYVRDEDGQMLAEIQHFHTQEFGPGTYSVELCGPIKMYLRVEGPVAVSSSIDGVSIETGGPIRVGARSYHEQPEATITVTDDPEDVMTAVSMLGSALKTDSAERSYPTLRGHPPTLQLGDELDVPEHLERPETGVTIEVPPQLSYVFPAASLAYYLGAAVEPGEVPRIVTDSGYSYVLETVRGYQNEVERVLKQVFFLDCVTRTEGYYKVDLHERELVEDRLDVDFAALYDLSSAARFEAYMDVRYEDVESAIPEWKLSTHVAPRADNVELLPFLVKDLAVIRMPEGQRVSAAEAQLAAINDFTRDFTRSASKNLGTPSLVQPEATDSLEQAWAGEDAPIGASKASTTAFKNRLRRETSEGDIDIAVVCNDPAMNEEHDIAAEVYGSREEFPFEVSIYQDLSTAALRAVIETEHDFLHYIGHIDNDGFQCADGKLDAHDLDFVGVDAFLLNACRSYEQGMALIERGAIGGVVTLAEVINSGAVRVGRTMVRLLNQGFPLRAALDIAKDRSIVGGQYIVVGDGNVDVVQLESSAPLLSEITTLGDDEYEVSLRAYPTESKNMGSMTCLLINDEKHYLSSGELDRFTLDREELWQVVDQEAVPILFDDEFVWSDELELADL